MANPQGINQYTKGGLKRTSKKGVRTTHKGAGGRVYDTKTGSMIRRSVDGTMHFNVKTGSKINY